MLASEAETENPTISLTVAKALKVLDAFTVDASSRSLRVIAKQLQINPTSVFRILRTFTEAGYMEQDPITGRYRIGPKALGLALAYSRQNPLAEIAKEVFARHSSQFEYNFYLGSLFDYQVVFLAVLDGRGPISIRIDPGQTFPLHATALGKILLAYAPDEVVSHVIQQGLKRFTPRTITDPQVLQAELPKIRAENLATNDGEHYDQVASIAVPLADPSGRIIASLSLAYPRLLFRQHEVDNAVSLLRQMSGEIMGRYSHF